MAVEKQRGAGSIVVGHHDKAQLAIELVKGHVVVELHDDGAARGDGPQGMGGEVGARASSVTFSM